MVDPQFQNKRSICDHGEAMVSNEDPEPVKDEIGKKVAISRMLRKRAVAMGRGCLLYTSPSPRDKRQSRMPSSA